MTVRAGRGSDSPKPSGRAPGTNDARLSRSGSRAPRRLTGRALVLAAVLVMLVLLLAAPLQRYLAHRTSIAAAEKAQQQLQSDVSDLEKQKQQWQDPAYVEQQARSRLQYVMPGDTVYQVVTPGSTTDPAKTVPTATSTAMPGDSWGERLWGSVEQADKPAQAKK
jgi:cell division protein FtsB